MSSHESSECVPLLLNDDEDDPLIEDEPDQLEARFRNRTHVHLEPDVIVHIEDNSDRNTPRPHYETGSGINTVQKRLLQTKDSRNLTTDLPLTDGKEAHFFISYSSEDRSTVLPIVAELEETHKIACKLDERDFISGMHIHDNIKKSMEKSMKVLLFLSKGFLQSSYCNHESNLAFVMSMRAGRNIVIPVKLEECEVPSILETLTYIDVSTENLADRIIEAYSKADTDFLPTDFDTVKTLENGYSVRLSTEREDICILRPNRSRTILDDKTNNLLKIGKFQVSQDTIQFAMGIINSYKSSGFWSRSRSQVYLSMAVGIVLFIVLGLLLSWGIVGTTLYTRRYSDKSADVEGNYSVVIVLIMLLGPVIVFLGMVGFYRIRRTSAMSNLVADIFARVTMGTYKEGVLFKVSDVSDDTTLEIVRYDIKPCQRFLARKIKEIMEKNGNVCEYLTDGFEDKADYLIRGKLFEYMYGNVPDAPENRHNVKGGKSCFCQMLEPCIEQYVNASPKPPVSDQTLDTNELGS